MTKILKSGGVFAFVARAIDRSRARRSLESLSDRELRDIGLSRGDIQFVVRNGVRRDQMAA